MLALIQRIKIVRCYVERTKTICNSGIASFSVTFTSHDRECERRKMLTDRYQSHSVTTGEQAGAVITQCSLLYAIAT